jgi:hypothetical protein
VSSAELFAAPAVKSEPVAHNLETLGARQTVAARIARAPTKEARQAIWVHVPAQWRELVRYNVALLLGGTIGTLPKLVDRRAALEQVPDDLRADVERETARVFLKGARGE